MREHRGRLLKRVQRKCTRHRRSFLKASGWSSPWPVPSPSPSLALSLPLSKGQHSRPGPPLLQVWNVNSCNGVVGVMNLQGASWDRARRRFHIHNSSPPTLTTTVRVADVEPFRASLQAAGCAPVAVIHAQPEGHPLARTPPLGSGNGALPVHGGERGSSGGNSAAADSVPLWAMYVGSTGKMHRVRSDAGVDVTVKGEAWM
jgi:hypothetical protein